MSLEKIDNLLRELSEAWNDSGLLDATRILGKVAVDIRTAQRNSNMRFGASNIMGAGYATRTTMEKIGHAVLDLGVVTQKIADDGMRSESELRAINELGEHIKENGRGLMHFASSLYSKPPEASAATPTAPRGGSI